MSKSIDLSDFDRLKNKMILLSNDPKKATSQTLTKVSGVIKTEAKKNLRQVTSRSKTKSVTKTGAQLKSIESAITHTVYKNKKGVTIFIKVRRKDNQYFRTKFFELGTKYRMTKGGITKTGRKRRKAHSTGKMTAHYFFQKAIDSKKDTAIKDVADDINKKINKIWNK